MYASTLTKTGSSESVAIPKPLRDLLGAVAPEPVRLDSPRDGVVVIYFGGETAAERLSKLERAEASNTLLSRNKSWPEGMAAEELIDRSRRDRSHGDYAL